MKKVDEEIEKYIKTHGKQPTMRQSKINRFIRKVQDALVKYKGSHVVIAHDVINLYNPVTRSYREWNPNEVSSWFILIKTDHETVKERFRFYALYNDLEHVMDFFVKNNVDK